MLNVLGVAAILVIGILFVLFMLKSANESTATIAQMPAIVERLRSTGKDESFVVFRFAPPGTKLSDDTAVELQFSIEGSRAGLDWVLLAPRNIADETRIADLARSLGFSTRTAEMNKVRYLRVEDGDIAALGMRIAKDLYGADDASEAALIVEDFDWPPAS
jgi:hypothetical protein